MQPVRVLIKSLDSFAAQQRYLFAAHDLRSLLPLQADASFKTLLSRAVKENHLERVCRGLYIYPPGNPHNGLILFQAAAILRANEFNYISLETVLSDVGAISQVPINRIFIMSSGRSNTIDCGKWGSIEFIHTNRQPSDMQSDLLYDSRCGLWRANVSLALKDMRLAHRSLDLIDWSVISEYV